MMRRVNRSGSEMPMMMSCVMMILMWHVANFKLNLQLACHLIKTFYWLFSSYKTLLKGKLKRVFGRETVIRFDTALSTYREKKEKNFSFLSSADVALLAQTADRWRCKQLPTHYEVCFLVWPSANLLSRRQSFSS